MAANERSKSTTWAKGDKVLNTQFETVEANAAGSVSRYSTFGGTVNYPLHVIGSNDVTYTGVVVNASGSTSMSSTVDNIILSLDRLPNGHTLSSAYMKLTPATGHTSEPATLPAFFVQAISLNGTASTLGGASVSWVSTVAYESGFGFLATCGAHEIDLSSYRYQVLVRTEHGVGSVGNCKIDSLRIGVSVDRSSGGTDFSHWV